MRKHLYYPWSGPNFVLTVQLECFDWFSALVKNTELVIAYLKLEYYFLCIIRIFGIWGMKVKQNWQNIINNLQV